MLQADPVPESPVPVAVMPSDANLFNLLKGNHVMKVINAELVPIMIATAGSDFYDRNHTEKAANHIANIIAARELGGFTKDTLPRALSGRKVEMTNFMTNVLANIGAPLYHFLHFCFELMIV
jgi:hypothetical protein